MANYYKISFVAKCKSMDDLKAVSKYTASALKKELDIDVEDVLVREDVTDEYEEVTEDEKEATILEIASKIKDKVAGMTKEELNWDEDSAYWDENLGELIDSMIDDGEIEMPEWAVNINRSNEDNKIFFIDDLMYSTDLLGDVLTMVEEK